MGEDKTINNIARSLKKPAILAAEKKSSSHRIKVI